MLTRGDCDGNTQINFPFLDGSGGPSNFITHTICASLKPQTPFATFCHDCLRFYAPIKPLPLVYCMPGLVNKEI